MTARGQRKPPQNLNWFSEDGNDDGPPGLEDIEETREPHSFDVGGFQIRTLSSQTSSGSSFSKASLSQATRQMRPLPVQDILSEGTSIQTAAPKTAEQQEKHNHQQQPQLLHQQQQQQVQQKQAKKYKTNGKQVETALKHLTREFNWSPRSPEEAKKKRAQSAAADPFQIQSAPLFSEHHEKERHLKKNKKHHRFEIEESKDESESQSKCEGDTKQQGEGRRTYKRHNKKHKTQHMNRTEIQEYIERVNESIRVANQKTESLPLIQLAVKAMISEIEKMENDTKESWSTTDMLASKRECLYYLRENEVLIEEMNKQSKICSNIGRTLVDFHEIITVQLSNLREKHVEGSLSDSQKHERKRGSSETTSSYQHYAATDVVFDELLKEAQHPSQTEEQLKEFKTIILQLTEELSREKYLRQIAERDQELKTAEFEKLFTDALEAKEIIRSEMISIQTQKEELHLRQEAIVEKENAIKITKQQQQFLPQQKPFISELQQDSDNKELQETSDTSNQSVITMYFTIRKRGIQPYRQFLETMETTSQKVNLELSKKSRFQETLATISKYSVDSALTLSNSQFKFQSDNSQRQAHSKTSVSQQSTIIFPQSTAQFPSVNNQSLSEQQTRWQNQQGRDFNSTKSSTPLTSRFRADTFGAEGQTVAKPELQQQLYSTIHSSTTQPNFKQHTYSKY